MAADVHAELEYMAQHVTADEFRTAALAEVARMQAELDRLHGIGDAQFARVEQVAEQINAEHEFLSEILDDAVHAWRSVRG